MSNVKKSWRDVTINEYFDLVDMIDEEQEDYSKEVKTIAFVYNMDEDEVWNLSVPEFHRLQAGKAWMGKFEINTNAVFKSIKIGDMKCEINVSLMDFTVAQYIDFQTFWPHRDEMGKYIGNILACFIIPKGMKYNEGYDIQKLAETIRENVDIMTANEIIFFFSKLIAQFNKGYPNLLEGQSDEDEEEDEGREEKRVYGEGPGADRGTAEEHFGWLSLVDKVSETVKKPWDDVFAMNVYEFFNLLAYIKWKDNKLKQQIDRWKQSHTA